MAYSLKLSQSLPFAQCPAIVELDGAKIALNNVILPRAIDPENAYNPHNIRLWVIGHEHGPVCAVWASHEQEAFDEACDQNMLESFMVSDADQQAWHAENPDSTNDDWTYVGSASEAHDLTCAWCAPVEFDAARDIALIVAIVRRTEQQNDTL